ncbi:hypothetical protein U1Q18_037706, partial [Sarracenia purpurea var. burkii]
LSTPINLTSGTICGVCPAQRHQRKRERRHNSCFIALLLYYAAIGITLPTPAIVDGEGWRRKEKHEQEIRRNRATFMHLSER